MKKTAVIFAPILLVSLILGWLTIDQSRVTKDGANSYSIAYTLLTLRAYSTRPEKPTPTMGREPFPIFSLAVWTKAHYHDLVDARPDRLNKTGYASIKRINLVWYALLLGATFFAARSVCRNELAPAAATVIVSVSTLYYPATLNSLNTDLLAGALLMVCIWLMMGLTKKFSYWSAGVTGLTLGLLALTKAMYLYAAIPMAFTIACLVYVTTRDARRSIAGLALMLAGLAAVVSPWIIRNVIVFDTPAIATRGGRVLYYRSLINDMPSETYRAAFYIWSPPEMRWIVGAALGMGDEVLDSKGKGAAAPLNRGKSSFKKADTAAENAGTPEFAISYVSQMRAEHNRLAQTFVGGQSANTTVPAQAILSKMAVDRIEARPFNHLAAIAPLYWQMLWVRTLPFWLAPIVNAALFVGVLVGLVRKDWSLVVLTLFPLGVMALYLLASHALPRYNEPLVPAMIVAAVVLAWHASGKSRRSQT